MEKKKFKVSYYFDGNGEVIVEAKSEKEARDLFFSGETDFETEKEWGEQYQIAEINLIK
jgi:hypothetical protein